MAPLPRGKWKRWCLYVSSFLVLSLPPASAVALTIFLHAAFGNYHPGNPVECNYGTVETKEVMKFPFTAHRAGDRMSALQYSSYNTGSTIEEVAVDSHSLSKTTVQEEKMKVKDVELNAQEKKELVKEIRDLYRVLVRDSPDEGEKRQERSLREQGHRQHQ